MPYPLVSQTSSTDCVVASKPNVLVYRLPNHEAQRAYLMEWPMHYPVRRDFPQGPLTSETPESSPLSSVYSVCSRDVVMTTWVAT